MDCPKSPSQWAPVEKGKVWLTRDGVQPKGLQRTSLTVAEGVRKARGTLTESMSSKRESERDEA